MEFEKTKLADLFIITLKPLADERGFFARSFCKREFEKFNLSGDLVQGNISYNRKKGTRRGLHYQLSPHGEIKIVSCRRGAIFDVVVDIRKNSSTYGKWLGIELSEKNNRMLYIPDGFAHGFQTLCDDVEVSYLMGNYYNSEAAAGISCNDVHLAISWPDTDEIIMSDRDKNFPGFMT